MAAVVLAAQLVIGAGVYVWTALALAAVFRKAGRAPWKAWVPVVNAWTLFELAGMRGWWSVVIAGAALVAGVAAAVLGGALGSAALSASFSGDAGAAQSLIAAALVVPVLLWLVVAVPALILHVRMLIRVGRGFGLTSGHVVLGALLFPVWASIVGWGSARWLGGGAGVGAGVGAAPSPVAPSEPTPLPPVVPALADFSRRPAPAPAFSHVPVFGAGPSDTGDSGSGAPGVPPAFGSGPMPFGAPARPAANPWAPPSPSATAAIPAAAATPAAPASAFPAAASATPAAPSPAAPSAADDAVEDHTVLAGRKHPSWSLVLPGGAVVALTGDTAVLGRNPVAPAHAPGAQVVPVDDVTRTVSKTHALLTRTATGWTVTDLDSTNGVFVGATPDGASEVDGFAPVEGPFFLGDAPLTLRAGA